MADSWTLVIHGGSGSMTRDTLSPAEDAGGRAGLAAALAAGAAVLREGGGALDAGAVTGVTRTRHPVSLARAVMERSPARPAEQRRRRPLLRRTRARAGRRRMVRDPERRRQLDELRACGGFDITMKYGTVGAVAADRHGHVAAGTSTGGLTAKRWGRIGDSPLIGAGTYATTAPAPFRPPAPANISSASASRT